MVDITIFFAVTAEKFASANSYRSGRFSCHVEQLRWTTPVPCGSGRVNYPTHSDRPLRRKNLSLRKGPKNRASAWRRVKAAPDRAFLPAFLALCISAPSDETPEKRLMWGRPKMCSERPRLVLLSRSSGAGSPQRQGFRDLAIVRISGHRGFPRRSA